MENQNNHVFYTHHNYDYYNQAADLNINKHYELNKIARYKRLEGYFKVALIVIIALCIVALTISLILWVHKQGTNKSAIENAQNTKSEQVLAEERKNMKDLIDNQENQPATFGVSREFHMFNKQYTQSGDEVVTGKKFLPSDLENPVFQYCYASMPGSNKRDDIARKKDGEVSIVTKDHFLLENALPLCVFQ